MYICEYILNAEIYEPGFHIGTGLPRVTVEANMSNPSPDLD